MYKTLSSYDFHDAFTSSDSYKDSFSYEARQALFDYLEELYDSSLEHLSYCEAKKNLQARNNSGIELDIVDLACEYAEYPSAIEACDDYTEDAPYLLDEDELEDIDQLELQEKQNEKALEYLEDRTQVIRIPNSEAIIIANF